MAAIIEIKNLTKTFGTGESAVHALSDVSLTVNEGDVFGVIGLSGAGKSTLVRCINRLEKPDGGEIRLNGQNVLALSQRELNRARQGIGMIFQQFNLLAQATILENVRFPMAIAGWDRAKADARARELLARVGLAGRESAYPSQLSGGMKQRVAIARALALSPKVLLCDEATSALDPATTRSILALLKDINRELGVTVVIITHEMAVIEEICTRVAILDQSRVAECGAVEDIFANPRSSIARQLIFAGDKRREVFRGKRCLRLVFDGKSAFEPVIADMVLACGAPVSILFADTKPIEGVTYGQMVIQLPDDGGAVSRILRHLDSTGVRYFEEQIPSDCGANGRIKEA